jgi:hypothetical protein
MMDIEITYSLDKAMRRDFHGSCISKLKVMKSAAGWYVGREYTNYQYGEAIDSGLYSTESQEYYNSRQEAEHALEYYFKDDEE